MKVSEGALIVKELLYLLRSKNKYVRDDAARALAGLSEKSFRIGLVEALNDSDPFTRQKSAQVLVYYSEDTNVRELLLRLANNDPSEDVRMAACESIRKLEFKLKVA
jgi:HEAT repeat protein